MDAGDATEVHHHRMLINGSWVESSSGERLACVNPYSAKEWGSVPIATAEDVRRAVSAAKRAFEDDEWRSSTPAWRAQLLRSLGDLIADSVEELSAAQSRENGKVLRELRGQVRAMVAHCHYFAGLAETVHGHTIPSNVPGMFTYTVREPVGVVAAITPWNSPLPLLLWKLAPALASGCTMVVKPSEVTPVSTLMLARLLEQAGCPPGVVNVVTGAGATGARLVEDPGIDRVAFTGSTDVGRRIARTAADRFARVSLELGGKSPHLVFPDADLEKAAAGVVAGVFGAAGQTCIAGSRALVHRDVYADMASRLVERARRIKLGDPLDEATEMGPLASPAQHKKVLEYIKIGLDEGAELLCGGQAPEGGGLKSGWFVEPTIFGAVRNDMRIAQEEVFGPVLCLIPFDDEDEAVHLANDSHFGLAAGVWTKDLARGHRLTRRLRVGTVWLNTYRKSSYSMPFGGFKDSGIGRENGMEAIHEYTETKSVWVDTAEGIRDPFDPRA